jgi:hypothetical protein
VTRGVVVTAALVAAFLVVQALIGLVVTLVQSFAYAGPGMTGSYFQGAGYEIATTALPIGVGVFLSFRLVAQITATISLRMVLLRSIVASVIAAILQFVVGLMVIFSTSFTGSLFANSIPWSDIGTIFGSTVSNFGSVVGSFVGYLPLIALAAVLLWLWLRREPVSRSPRE